MHRTLLVAMYLLCALMPARATAQTASATGKAAPPAAPATSVMDEVERLRVAGFNAIFSLDYSGAAKAFNELIKTAPDLPQGYLYRATNTWLKVLYDKRLLSTSLYSNDEFFEQKEKTVEPAVDQAFRKDLDKAIALSEARLKTNPNDIDAMYFLGASHGVLAGYEASMARAFMSALSHGGKAVDLHEKGLKLDPKYADAYLTVGTYHFVVGSLPFVVKTLAAIGGVRGSKRQGITELERVASDGKRANDDARTILIGMYAREKRLPDSLAVIRTLKAKYPLNYVLALEEANVLAKMKRYDEAFPAYDALLSSQRVNAEAKDFVAYAYAEALRESGHNEKAIAIYGIVWTWQGADPDLVTLARLGAGQCHDVLGQRDQALAQYRMVLRRADILDSRKRAEEFTKKPYSPSSPIASTGHDWSAS